MLIYMIKPLGQTKYTQTDRKGFLRFLVHTCKVGDGQANRLLQMMENDIDEEPLTIESPFYKGEFLKAKIVEF